MKKLLAILLTAALLCSMVCFAGAEDFTDAADIGMMNTEAVTVLSSLKVIAGMGDGTFAPKGSLTRAQAAKIICYMLLGAEKAEALAAADGKFGDVPASHWSNKYVAYCADQGIAAGTGAGKFNPNGKLTGFAFAKMLLCGVAGFDAAKEGLTGADWEINTSKLLKQEALSMGVSVSAKEMSREDACHLALNFLFYGEKDDPMSTLAYKTFAVTREPGKTDRNKLCRPTVTYSTENEDAYWDGTEMIVDASPFFFSPSGAVTGGKLYTACGDREVATENMIVYRNSMTATIANVVNSIAKNSTSGFEEGRMTDGVSLEAYYDGVSDMFTFVILSTRAAKITAVTEAVKTSDGRVLEPGSVTFENGNTLENDEFTEADIGSYACVQGMCDSSWYNDFKTITNAFRGEIVSGKLTKADKSGFTVGGKTFKTTNHSQISGEEWLAGGHEIGEEVHVLTYYKVALAVWTD